MIDLARGGEDWEQVLRDELLRMARNLTVDPERSLTDQLDHILAELVPTVSADRGFIYLPEGGQLVLKAARGADGSPVPDPDHSRTVAQKAAEEFMPIRIDRPTADPRTQGSPSIRNLGIVSVLGAPMRRGRKILGSVVFDRRGREEPAPFTRFDERLVAEFAEMATHMIASDPAVEALGEDERRTVRLPDPLSLVPIAESGVETVKVLSLAEYERRALMQALQASSGNLEHAAQLLEITHEGLERKLALHGLGESHV